MRKQVIEVLKQIVIYVRLLLVVMLIACLAFLGVGMFLTGIAGTCISFVYSVSLLKCAVLCIAGIILFLVSCALILYSSDQPWIA